MSVNNLRNYNWEQGTQASPVLLTGAEFNKLTALIEESNRVGSNINANIRGWVQVGQNITSYQKYLAELTKDGQDNPLLHVVNTQIDPVSYTVIPQSSSIKEGNSTKLNINGISLSALKFRITNHTVQSLDYQERTTIDTQLGYVRVAPAQENTTWTDVVTIQTCPVWEEWTDLSASIVEFDVTVNAISVSSVTITAPQYVKPTETFYPVVNFLPVNHTKPIVNTLEDAGAKRGICFVPTSDDFAVGKTTDPTKMSAIAPSTETPVGDTWSLGCGVYAFTNAQTMATPIVNVAVKYPYIQFTVTTDGTFSDISTANPKITLQKVDSQDTPIGEPIVITGTVSGSSLVYTYGGGLVAGDGSETYKVSIENVRGYITPNIADIVPNGIITEVNTSYTAIQPDVYIVYSDKSIETYDIVLQRGSIQQGKTPIGVRILTAQTDFVVSLDNHFEPTEIDNDGRPIYAIADNNNNITLPKAGWVWNVIDTTDDDVVTANNEYYLSNISVERDALNNIFFKARNKTISIDNINYNGYIGGKTQMEAMSDNFGKISTLFTLSNKQIFDITVRKFLCYTHGTYARAYIVYKKGDAGPVWASNDVRWTVNGITYDAYIDENYIVVPIYFIDF